MYSAQSWLGSLYYLAILYLYSFHRLIFFFVQLPVFHPSGVMAVCSWCSNRCLGEVPRCHNHRGCQKILGLQRCHKVCVTGAAHSAALLHKILLMRRNLPEQRSLPMGSAWRISHFSLGSVLYVEAFCTCSFAVRNRASVRGWLKSLGPRGHSECGLVLQSQLLICCVSRRGLMCDEVEAKWEA